MTEFFKLGSWDATHPDIRGNILVYDSTRFDNCPRTDGDPWKNDYASSQQRTVSNGYGCSRHRTGAMSARRKFMSAREYHYTRAKRDSFANSNLVLEIEHAADINDTILANAQMPKEPATTSNCRGSRQAYSAFYAATQQCQ